MKNQVSKFKGLTLSLKLTQTKKVKKVDTLIEFVSNNQQIKTDSIQFESLEFAKQMALIQDQLADFRQPINAEGFRLSKKFDIQRHKVKAQQHSLTQSNKNKNF